MVNSGKKVSLEDMNSIKDDVVDVFARKQTALMLELSASASHHLTAEQKSDLKEMTELLQQWDGSFDLESVSATVYNKWYIQFLRSLFHNYSDDEDQRMLFSGTYHFMDTFYRLVTSVRDEGESSRYQVLCEGAHKEYSGRNPCAFNLAMALVETKQFLSSEVSWNSDNWTWGTQHVN